MNHEEATEARNEALNRVSRATDPDWSHLALKAVFVTAYTHQDFISDDVWETGLESTREDRALGPVFIKAAKEGWIRKTDRVRPSVRSHLSGKPIWESLIYMS